MSKQLSIGDVPKYLHNSQLYETLKECTESTFDIPPEYFREEIIINSDEDLQFFIKLLNYWMINDTPYEIYDYVLKNKKTKPIKIEENNNQINKEINLIKDKIDWGIYDGHLHLVNIYIKKLG